MSEMGAAEFKAHCLRVMERVRRTRRSVTITKRGVPVAKLVPADPPKKFVLGSLAGRFTSAGDLVSSPHSDEEWKAMAQSRLDRWRLAAGKPVTRKGHTRRARKTR
jgi:prevent-host-death family protein